MAGDVFSLSRIYDTKTEPKKQLRESKSNQYGYYGGGYTGTGPTNRVSTIDRLDFSTETVIVPGPSLSQARNNLAATSSSSYGYFAGGFIPGNVSTIDRLDFSTETVIVPGPSLSQARNNLAATSSSSYGYFAGGFAPGSVCTIDRLDFSTETVSVPGPSLSQARSGLAAVSTSSYGYFGGGSLTPTSLVCTIDRLDFSTDTITIPIITPKLSQARDRLAATSSSSYGYFAGGFALGSVCTIDRLDFSTETVTVPTPSLSQARTNLAEASSSSYSYFGGGYFPPSTRVCTIDRLDFFTETVTTPTPKLSQARTGLEAVSYRSTPTFEEVDNVLYDIPYIFYGYFGGGQTPTPVSTIDRLDFSTEIVTTPTPKLSQARGSLAAVSSSLYGYFGGGTTGTVVSTIDRLDFSTETVTVPTPKLSQARSGLAAVSSSLYGYFSGGDPGPLCTIDRLDFSTETVGPPPAPAPNQLSQARSGLAAVSNSSYGYFAGGTIPGPTFVCTIDRLDFSTESVSVPAATAPNRLRRQTSGLAAVSSSSYGYFAGGFAPTAICTIDRLDFSTETVSAGDAFLSRLSQARANFAAVANSPSAFGYFGGGYRPGAGVFSTIDRLDFITDSYGISTPSPKLSQARSSLASAIYSNKIFLNKNSNSLNWSEFKTFGYIATGDQISTIDRIDFSTETVTTPDSKIKTGRIQTSGDASGVTGASGVYSQLYGYVAGGYDANDASSTDFWRLNTINRLDFSTDGVAIINSKLTKRGWWGSGVSGNSYGYFGGGYTFVGSSDTGDVYRCNLDRLDFSTELVTTTNTDFKYARLGCASVSTNSYGYFGGGDFAVSRVLYYDNFERLEFSTETASVPSYFLSKKRRGLSAFSSKSYAYFAGGFSPPIGFNTYVCTIDRLDFSNELTSVIAPRLPDYRETAVGTQSNHYGYIAGGARPAVVSLIERLDFSTETLSTPAPKLSSARSRSTALSGGTQVQRVGTATAGYFAGGFILPSAVCTINRLDFSTETVSVPTPKLSQGKQRMAATSSSFYGFYGGGINTLPAYVSTIDRLDFSTETVTVPTPKLSQAKNFLTAISSSSYGYFGGGYFPPLTSVCTIDRLDFFTETVTEPTSKLSSAKLALSATSSSSYGYFGGGNSSPSSALCTIDRLDFSTETVTVPGAQLSSARNFLTAISSSSYGYFAGGLDPLTSNVCTIDRLDFSTETATVPGPQLSRIKQGLAAVSSSSYGYFGGGSAPPQLSTIDRLDFSTETVTTPTPKLSQARTFLTAVSNAN